MRPHIITALFLFLSGVTSYASPDGGSVHPPMHISEEAGLSSNSVNCIYQSQDGLIWIGTDTGLTRYDGNRCSNYFTDSKVNAITSGSEGDIYVGTDNHLLLIHREMDGIDTVDVLEPKSNLQHISALYRTGETVYLVLRTSNGRELTYSDAEYSEERITFGHISSIEGRLTAGKMFSCSALFPVDADPFNFFERKNGGMIFGGWLLDTSDPLRNMDPNCTRINSFSHITGYAESPEGDILYTKLTEPHLYRYTPSSDATVIGNTFGFLPKVSMQGQDDIIYIGYDDGLIKYHYTSGTYSALLSGVSVNALMLDSGHNLWVGTENGVYVFSYLKSGISFEDISTETFPGLHYPTGLWNSGTGGFTVKDCCTDSDGRTWAATYGAGPVCMDKSSLRLYPDTYSIRTHQTTAVSYYNRKRDAVFTCRHLRYDRFDLGDRTWHHYAPDVDDSRIDFTESERIDLSPEEFVSKDIVYMEDDANWLVTPRRLVRHDLNDGTITTVLTYTLPKNGYTEAVAYPSHTDACQMQGKGYFYIAAGNILYKVDVASMKTSAIYRQGTRSPHSIPALRMAGRIFETRTGTLLFGSGWYADGIYSLDPVTHKAGVIKTLEGKKKLLHNIVEDDDGNILIYASRPARICAFDPDTWEVQYEIPSGSVSHLLMEGGTLWVSGSLKPLMMVNMADTSDVTVYTYSPDNRDSLSCKTILKVIPLRDSLYLLEGRTHQILFDRKTGTFDNDFFLDPYNISPLGTSICIDTAGRLWYGSRNGLSIIDRKRKTTRTYTSDIHFRCHIPQEWINDIISDREGTVWIGTRTGILRYDADGDSLVSVRFLSGKDVRSILEDDAGRLWFATSNGLYCKFTAGSDSLRRFSSFMGLNGNNYNGESLARSDGRLSFNGPSGWTTFHPDSLNSHTEPSPIIITDFTIGGRPAQERLKGSVLDLQHSENSISFYFSCSDFIFNKYLLYRYRLSGVDADWIYTDSPLLFVNYSEIPPGRHTLELEVSNIFREWKGVDGFSIPVRIRYPAWCQWWSILIYLALVLLLMHLTLLIREESHRREKARLETMVAERTANLKKEVNLKNKFFSILSHDLKSPVNGAAFTAEVFLRQYDSLNEMQRKEMLELLRQSLVSSSEMLNSIMLWRQSQSTEIEPKYQIINLRSICRQIVDMQSAAFHKKEVSLKMDIPEDICVRTDKNMLSTILRNLIGNALKYSYREGEVSISCRSSVDGKVQISVQDHGIGMDRNTLEHLFTLHGTERRKGTENENGSGLGLLIISEFLHKLGETIKIKSEPKKGSIFTFTLPSAAQKQNSDPNQASLKK